MTKSDIIDMMTADQMQIFADVLEKSITDGAEAACAQIAGMSRPDKELFRTYLEAVLEERSTLYN